jgi:hypothetical protein
VENLITGHTINIGCHIKNQQFNSIINKVVATSNVPLQKLLEFLCQLGYINTDRASEQLRLKKLKRANMRI